MAINSRVNPYGTARDLPSVQEMEQQLAGFKLLGFLLPKELREKLKDLTEQHRHITATVDRFYDLLGERNWVFTDDLNLSAIEHVTSASDATTAEARLVDYYKASDRIAFPLRRLHRFDAMRPRIELLEKALADYEAGRYYSTVFVLLAVMDGFVNELNKTARQGLHAREPEDMVAWDSMAGHHLGLSNAHRSFLKGCYKTDTTEVTDLYRHGIMHGTLVNFDNVIIATKAWNRLFAVTDWAEAKERQAKPIAPTPSWRESLNRWMDIQRQSTRIEEWQPFEYEPTTDGEDPSSVASVCADFLERWQRRQWGLVASHFMGFGSKQSAAGKFALEAKDLYGAHELSSWKITRVRHVGVAIAHTDVELRVNDSTFRTDLRWVRVDESGNIAMDGLLWALQLYGPSHFLKAEKTLPAPQPDE